MAQIAPARRLVPRTSFHFGGLFVRRHFVYGSSIDPPRGVACPARDVRDASSALHHTSADNAWPSAAPSARELRAIALTGLRLIAEQASTDLGDLLHMSALALANVLHADFSHIGRLGADGDTLLLEAGVGWHKDLIGTVVGSCGDSTVERHAIKSPGPIVVADVIEASALAPLTQVRQHGDRSGIVAVILAAGQPYGLLGSFACRPTPITEADRQFVADVTGIIAAAVERHRLRRLEASIIEDGPDMVARLDPELRCEYVNSALSTTIGFDAPEAIGRTLVELGLIPPLQLGSWRATVHSVLRTGRERKVELGLLTPQGERRLLVRFVPDLTIGQVPRSLLMLARDLTEVHRLKDECAALRQELIQQERRHHEQVARLIVDQREERKRSDDAALIVAQLTRREVEILGMLTEGLTNRQIAALLYVSPGTVRNHLGRIFPKLDVADRTRAAVRAVELGLTRAAEV